jgi:hypothetical protein
MEAKVERLRAFAKAAAREVKTRKRLVLGLLALVVLQLYFVRELIAAEVLFGLGFIVLLALGGILYLVGAAGERGFNLIEEGARAMAPAVRSGYVKIEEISKKPFRHPRSESAR